MPDRQILEKCCKLARDRSARILTSVFQTDTAEKGVCRAMASSWIHTGLRSAQDSGGWALFRAKADTTETDRVDSSYVLLHKIQVETFGFASGYFEESKKAEELSQQISKETKFAEQLVKQREELFRSANRSLEETRKSDETVEASITRQEKLGAEAQAQFKVVAEATQRLAALTGSNGVTEKLDLYVDKSTQNFGDDKDNFCQTRLKFNGYYYLGLKRHAVALYYNGKGECRFFDANTGEWVFRNGYSLALFFPAYFESIYGRTFDDDPYSVHGYVASPPPAECKEMKGCPFPTCPFSGTFTFACQYDK